MTDVMRRLATALADRYVIERELGAGGMATVYLAHDVRHDRKVALKVLRPELSAILGGERFLAEIKTTANLQHPHILSLFDSGEAEGTVFYVMPYVDGESLRDRLAREKQLPVEDAVRIAAEVASALDYAHRHGVVHRDIKPENILLHDGTAQVADFGIALAASRSDGGTRMTETGMSLGTPHYMSPEQAMGEKEITLKADIYAVGCVLYEMLTAEPPFTGATAQAIIARVMTEEPRSLTLQRHTIPSHIEAVVRKALEKLPADRFHSAAEFSAALANPAFAVAAPAAAGRRSPSRAAVWRHPVTLALTGVALAATVVAGWALLQREPVRPVYRFGLSLPADAAPVITRPFALSRDGAKLLYFGPTEPGRPPRIWVKFADRYEAVPVAGTEGANHAVFSPDGEWIAFTQSSAVKKVRVTGGASVTLAEDASTAGALAWLDDGTILYGRPGLRVLNQVPAAGGIARIVWSDSSGLGCLNLTPVPGGRALASCLVGSAVPTLRLFDPRDSVMHEIQSGVQKGFYLPTGHIAYVRPDGAMFALPFDLDAVAPTGEPVPIRDSIAIPGTVPLLDIADNGTMVMRVGALSGPNVNHYLVWVDRTGRETTVDSGFTFRHVEFGGNAGWALSPDGSRLAIGLNTDAGDNIWVKQLPAGPAVRVTFDSAAEYRPRWMPGGRTVLFGSNRSRAPGLYVRAADGTGTDSLLLRGNIYEGAVSGDGRWLVARAGGSLNQLGGRNLSAMRLGTDSTTVPLIATSFDESEIALSPDGRWLAYVSDETGRPEVFVRPFPEVESAKHQVSVSGGVAPLWARNGRELFFVSAAREMVVVPVSDGPTLRLGPMRVLFRIHEELYLTAREFYTPYDVSPDGRRFIMARRMRSRAEIGPAREAPLIVTRNWFEELARLMEGR